ncbi:MAG: hypothetical protein GY913_22515 [Proteobacteria bacterium]|nr:hypothetical protein [Pseudomonadota bacterium]MCP4919684.1 hypothetical protein [Pseudomonadota bacterium]
MHPFLQRGKIRLGDEVSATHLALMRDLDTALCSDDEGEVQACLDRLKSRLPRHFAAEEAEGGVFDWITALVPDRRDDVRQLVDQHRALLEAVSELSLDTLESFATRLRGHEAAERVLIKTALAEAEG